MQQTTKNQRQNSSDSGCLTIEVNCPMLGDFLPTLKILRKIEGLTPFTYEFTMPKISILHKLKDILLRELQEEQQGANQLKTISIFDSLTQAKEIFSIGDRQPQGWVKMSNIRFMSPYHCLFFTKFYQKRLKQMEKEYGYLFVSKSPYLRIYFNDQKLSKMLICELCDMKKKLVFLDYSNPQLCEKFLYSHYLQGALEDKGIFTEIWHRRGTPQVIFYSTTSSVQDIKKTLRLIGAPKIEVLQLFRGKEQYYVKYCNCVLLQRATREDIARQFDKEGVKTEFNRQQLALIIHDNHPAFTQTLRSQMVQILKQFFFVNLKSRSSRKVYNLMKARFQTKNHIQFSYSKKILFICLKLPSLRSQLHHLKELFKLIVQNCDQNSAIILQWGHLQNKSKAGQRENRVDNIIRQLSRSPFSIANFANLYEGRDPHCILRVKNTSLWGNKPQQLREKVELLLKLIFSESHSTQSFSAEAIIQFRGEKHKIEKASNIENYDQRTQQVQIEKSSDGSDEVFSFETDSEEEQITDWRDTNQQEEIGC